MKITRKKLGKTSKIQNIMLTFPQQQEFFESLKSKVSPDKKLMIAVSGGSDSILTASLMYNLFLKKKYNLQNLFFIHCNHNVRKGNVSDEAFIRDFFEDTQLIITKRLTDKKSTEAELRKWRYEEFKKYAKIHAIDYIVF